MSFVLSFFFAVTSILTSILVIMSSNPVHSVFFLILSFITICGNMFLLELEFLPLILIVIYVGAISVLFLFVTMMLDIKYIVKEERSFSSFLIGIFLSSLFFFCLFSTAKDVIFFSFSPTEINFDWLMLIDRNVDLFLFGQCLYSDFIVHFLVVGLILIVAIIGAVVLTMEFGKSYGSKNQFLFKQVARIHLETFYITK
jgi:NADH-quinone oxidoreductase subunit J